MLRRTTHVCIGMIVVCATVLAASRMSAAATQVILGQVTASYGNRLQMRSEAGNTVSVNRANAIVVDLAHRPLSWSAIRVGDAITVYGFVVSSGVVNAINLRIRAGAVPPGRHIVIGVITHVLGNRLQMRSVAGYALTVYRTNANVINAVGGASSWQALRAGQSITVNGSVVSDGVLDAINIRIR